MKRFVVVMLLAGCGGSLVEHWDTSVALDSGDGGSGADAGLFCAADDPCADCVPCSNTTDCKSGLGLTCTIAKRHGQECADHRSVCIIP